MHAAKLLSSAELFADCWGITIKTHGPGMMNSDQESEMRLIKEKFTEENSLQFHQQKSVSTLPMEFVGRSAYSSKSSTIIP